MTWDRLWRKDGTGWSRCCVHRTGVSVFNLAGRFAAGDSIAELAKDYDMPVESVTEAIRLYVSAAPRGVSIERRMADMLRKAGRDFTDGREEGVTPTP
jgi:uncharacterized protein (DUF433 family)